MGWRLRRVVQRQPFGRHVAPEETTAHEGFAMSVTQEVTEQSFARDRFSRSDAAIGLLVAGHFLFLALFFRPAISTPDANGYMAQARLIAREGRTDIVVESPVQYVGDHWMPVRRGVTTASTRPACRLCSRWSSGRWGPMRRSG